MVAAFEAKGVTKLYPWYVSHSRDRWGWGPIGREPGRKRLAFRLLSALLRAGKQRRWSAARTVTTWFTVRPPPVSPRARREGCKDASHHEPWRRMAHYDLFCSILLASRPVGNSNKEGREE